MKLDFALKLAGSLREMVMRAAIPQAATKTDRGFVTASDCAVE